MSSTASVQSDKDPLPAEPARSIERANEYEDAEKNFQPKSFKFWMIIVGVYLAIFLVALDRIIIATAIPRITDEFDSIQDIGWYGSAYALTCACFSPVSGRLYQLYSTKWVFLLSIAIFEAGSAICGAAPNSTTLVVGRAVAGLGAACIFSGGMMVTFPLIPLRKRPVFISMFGMAFGIASVLGPVLGGIFTDHVSWRWCFYLNLPIGGFTVVAVLLFLHVESPKREKLSLLAKVKRIDPLGISCFLPAMVCLILALQWGGSTYPWSAPRIIGLLVTFAVLFIAFVAVEVLIPQTAMAPTRVVLNRSVAGALLFVFLLSGAMMSIIYYLTLWFQVVKNDSAMHAGVSTIPVILSMVVIGILGAIVTQKIRYYNPALLASPVLCSLGAGLLTTLSPTSNHSAWIGYQVLYGTGLGLGFQTANLPIQNELPRADVPLGVGLVFFMQHLGSSVFLAVSQNVLSSRLVDRLSGIVGLDAQAIIDTGATNLRIVVPPGEVDTVVSAYNYALTRVFVLAAALSACKVVGVLAIKVKKIPGKVQVKERLSTPTRAIEEIKVDPDTKL